jgi:hypothetical protein
MDKEKNNCKHKQIIVDEQLWCIECAECGEKIDPIAYLANLAKEEKMIEFRIDGLRRIEKELSEKTKCKCEFCGKFTRIPHRESIY